METERKIKYTVLVEVKQHYTIEVIASDEEEAEAKAQELALSGEYEDNADGDFDAIAISVDYDADYEDYVDLCEEFGINAIPENQAWNKHKDKLSLEQWYRDDYDDLYNDDSSLITNLKEKKKYIKKMQDRGSELIKVKAKEGTSFKVEEMYFDIGNLRGIKRFYSIPYSKHITNDWVHLSTIFEGKLDSLLNMVDIYNKQIEPLNENEAIFILDKMNNI